MGRDVRVMVFWGALLAGLAGGAFWYWSNPALKCAGMGGEWVAATSLCWCDGVPVAL